MCRYLSGRNDPGDLFVTLASQGARDQQQQNIFNQPYRLPSFFAIDNPVSHHHKIGIIEDQCSRLKEHSVLSVIAAVLVFVLFKSQATAYTDMYIQKCQDKQA